ncbi:MAG: SPOR domain-containing protein [Gammaproteobacteria bacterium]|nr:SPOR domain-containing protein [Gammaproteobacteria bacterium]
MERKLQERMVGAGVLVLVLVILAPLILDGGEENGLDPQAIPGQRSDELRVRTFDLRATDDGRAPVLSTPSATPAPALPPPPPAEAVGTAGGGSTATEQAGDGVEEDGTASANAPESVEGSPVAAVAAPAPAVPPVVPAVASPPPTSSPAPLPKPATTAGGWVVQVGTFGEKGNAERLAAQLEKQGFAAVLSTTAAGGRKLYRVRVGPAATREAASTLAGKLAAAGHKGNVVPQ